MSHQNLTRLNDLELTAELEQSRKIIEDNIGLPVTMLATPMGRINDRVIRNAREAGYTIIMTSFTGINRDMDDLVRLRRFQVKSHCRELRLDDYFKPISAVRIGGAAKNVAKKIRNRLS
jgi:peptidoglycan/xylan/chitin deacetylase (PgdA/CDA1 family)